MLFITHVGVIYLLRRETGEHVLPPVELIPGATFDPADGVLACARGTAECPSANTLAIDLRTGRFFFTFWAPGAPQAGLRAMRVTEDPTPAITPLWTNDALPGGSASSPDLSFDGTRLYVNDNVDAVHALDAATGVEIWSFPIGFASGGSPSLSPGGIFMPAGGGASPLLALVDRGAAAELAWRRDDLLNRGIPTQAAGDTVYATVGLGQFRNDLVVVDAGSGAELDREPLAGTTVFTVGTTIGADGTVYVPALVGDLYAFRPANPACPATSRPGCRDPARAAARLAVRDDDGGARDRVRWKWRGDAAAADFGDPTDAGTYALCLYDAAGVLLYGADVPAGGTCRGRPCWRATGSGFRFKDPDRAPHGVSRVELRAGAGRKARIAVDADGEATFASTAGTPALPIPLPARVQLLNAAGTCWEAEHGVDGARRNDERVFRGTGR